MAHATTVATQSWILAEFTDVGELLSACRKMRAAGHTDVDTYSPYPLHGVDEALGWKPSRVPFIACGGAITGGSGALLMMYWMNGVDYPINVANRLLVSTPTWIPIMFEATVLLTGLSMFFGLMALLGFPRPHHPVFESEAWVKSATSAAYWISVTVPTGDADAKIQDELRSCGARTVEVVTEVV